MNLKRRTIFLDKPFEVVDGEFEKLDEDDDEVTVKLQFVEKVKISFPAGSTEAQLLKEKLTKELEGTRIIICRLDREDEPIRVAVKKERMDI